MSDAAAEMEDDLLLLALGLLLLLDGEDGPATAPWSKSSSVSKVLWFFGEVVVGLWRLADIPAPLEEEVFAVVFRVLLMPRCREPGRQAGRQAWQAVEEKERGGLCKISEP